MGGLATTAAFLITAHELISSRQREEKSNSLRAETALTNARKVSCDISGSPHTFFSDGKAKKNPQVTVWVVNSSRSAITDVRVLLDGEKEIARKAQINGLDSKEKIGSWQFILDPADLGLEPDPGTKAVTNTDQAKISVEFKMEGHRFLRVRKPDLWEGETYLIDERQQ